MAINLKIARTAKQLDDVFKLRYDVFVKDKGKFSTNSDCYENNTRLVDHFDTIPGVYNIIIYDNQIPIATMRVNKDSEVGLPSEMHFDFSETRKQIALECEQKQISPMIACASMLAVKKSWRYHKRIVPTLFKTAINIMLSFGASHLIASMSLETQSLCYRLGFKGVNMPQWSDHIGDHLIPMLAPFEKVFNWGFGDNYSYDISANKLECINENTSSQTNASSEMNERRSISREYLQQV